MSKISFPIGVSTTAIHAGEFPDPVTQASAPNIVMSTTFVTDENAGFSVESMEEDAAWVYTRWGNPTVHQLEVKLAALENAESAIAFASGMGAITALLFDTLKSGDHAIISDVAYAALSEMTNEMIPNLDIPITKVNTSDADAIKKAIRTNTKLIYIETPCNPLLRITDIEEVSAITHNAGAKLAVDSTFATPMATKPLDLGADYVIHSLTKYLGGHGDALGGIICGSRENLRALRKKTAIRLGGVLSPFNAWLIMRGIATFPIRMRAHAENALKVAQFLENHPKVKRVIYPGLPSHPQYELAKKQMHNFSGMLTFQVEDGVKAAHIFSTQLQVIHYAVSLGHHRSLIFYLPSKDLLESSFKFSSPEELESWKHFAGDGIFRFSVGLEDADDIIKDLELALEKI
ncbi:MAG: PLP-dependent aspartate aminotransferase family protein [Bacteroidota bacterium]|nr:PLP-dependent aspartate aminotransferase family protein [Bacteroidota bacterium]MDP4226811.1 PLP-dependent aspartate aminotransferase family protein [Bacteroidota bacterium]MDP4274882.1 PLP-dependent aspartate aminotransferase family protein [Bacteroidota bacterium]